MSKIADYGKLGHGEVVGMRIPEKMIGDFATEYFSFFSPAGGRLCVVYIYDVDVGVIILYGTYCVIYRFSSVSKCSQYLTIPHGLFLHRIAHFD